MDQTDLQKVCGDSWPHVKVLQQEFMQFEASLIPSLLESLCSATSHEWKLSDLENYHHFELRGTLEETQQLYDCFVQAGFGYVKLKQEEEGAVLHWHENPFQEIPEALEVLNKIVMSKVSANPGFTVRPDF